MTATSRGTSVHRATHPDGDGVDPRRAFPGAELSELDPFLLLDQLGPSQYAPAKPGDSRRTRTAVLRPSPTLSAAKWNTATPGVTTGCCGPATFGG